MHAIEALVQQINGASFVGIDAVTTVKLKGGKKNPMLDRVTKVMTGATVMSFNRGGEEGGYENMVNRRLQVEGKDVEFTVGPRKWGTRVEGKPIVEHNGEKYLEVVFLKPGKTHYELDGQPIEAKDIIGLELDEKEEGKQGGLENKVIIRTFKFDSITGLRIGGHAYDLKG